MRAPRLIVTLALLLMGVASAHSQTCPTCLPLDHVGGAPHRGFALGLYGAGTNLPTASHQVLAQAAAARVLPRDASGAPSADGLIGFLSIGMSNTNQEFAAFERLEDIRAGRNPRLVVVDGAVGGQSADVIMNPLASYWTTVASRIAAAGLDPDQVQVVWLKQADGAVPDTSFPAHAETLSAHLHRVVRDLRDRFPRLELCYLSSRIYGGYSGGAARSEPLSLENGFSVRWLIEQQMAGDPLLNADPNAGPVEAPVLLWGPYLWANGTTPRASDGLVWERADLEGDGVHPSPSGEAKVAALLQSFLAAAPTAASWRDATAGESSLAIDAEADSWVEDAQPGTNHGGDAEITWTNPGARGYLRFPLSAVTGDVFHAKLSLRTPADQTISRAEVVGVSNTTWDEGTITALDAPVLDGALFGAIPSASRGTALSLDVTGAVQAALAAGPDAKLSLALRASVGPGGPQQVTSRESGEAPRLVLSLSNPAVSVPPSRHGRSARLTLLAHPFTGDGGLGLALDSRVTDAALEVFDVHGRRAAVLHRGALAAGAHRFEWRPDGARSGVHLVRLRDVATGETLAQRKVVLLAR